jgi:hypothetical protein
MNRRIWRLSFLVVGIAFSAGQSALAQRARMGMPISIHPSRLMDVALKEPVLKELGIERDAAKIAEIRKLQETVRHQLVSIVRNRKGTGRRAQAYEIERKLQAKYNPELKKLLTTEQFSRLQQIAWQLEGPDALEDAEVVQALGITKEQQQKLVALSRETSNQVRSLLNPGGTPGPAGDKDVQAKLLALRTERGNKANEILSKTQQEKFAKLKAKPFDLALLRTRAVLRAGETGLVIDIKNPRLQVTVRGGMSPSVADTGPNKQEVPVDPGDHRLVITFAGLPVRRFTTKESFSIQEGQKRSIVVSVVDEQVVAKLDNQLLPLTLSTDKAKGKKK